MREFVFVVEYERGVDAFMDLFIEYPDLHARSVAYQVINRDGSKPKQLVNSTVSRFP